MPTAPDLSFAIGLPPTEAIAYFEGLGYQVSRNAIQAYTAARARAFTITGVARLDILQDIKGGLERSLRNGTTFSTFQDEVHEQLRRRGWVRLDDGTHADPATGEVVARLPPHRLQTIFRTNTQSALMAGRYQQMMEGVEIAPYWQYVAVMDERTRPSHAAANGRIFRHDDPFWDSHFPPCDFNCRCSVRALRGRDLERRGLTVDSSDGMLEPTEIRVGEHDVPATAFVDRTRRTRFVPGPGFGHRPIPLPGSGPARRAGTLGQVAGEKLMAADARIGAAAAKASPALSTALREEYTSWAQSVLAAGRAANAYRVVGAMSQETVTALQQRQQSPADAALVLRDVELLHLARDTKRARGAALSAAQILALPELLAHARAVLWDRTDPALVYVLDVQGQTASKVIVRVRWHGRLREGDERSARAFNSVRTAGVVQVGDLRTGRYELLEGALE
ncbi:phage head morphogenesis protein [Castellaniella caeni]|uniref:phage head morphogenesis protein n=1 Tax=Castellaniella caeni TaxID=266123 RepID=UPI000C9EDCF2|nr:phage minor head protein [Castellaniella caeni]